MQNVELHQTRTPLTTSSYIEREREWEREGRGRGISLKTNLHRAIYGDGAENFAAVTHVDLRTKNMRRYAVYVCIVVCSVQPSPLLSFPLPPPRRLHSIHSALFVPIFTAFSISFSLLSSLAFLPSILLFFLRHLFPLRLFLYRYLSIAPSWTDRK